ncbi:MAG TPA: hypothetical protein VG273_26200 [Bryobacteraceae bacterium]|nr:hypothetical protein [Bryobacteraceae bacterium]
MPERVGRPPEKVWSSSCAPEIWSISIQRQLGSGPLLDPPTCQVSSLMDAVVLAVVVRFDDPVFVAVTEPQQSGLFDRGP